jgi:hypothetical protein
VSRLKDRANPVITDELREWRGSHSGKLLRNSACLV